MTNPESLMLRSIAYDLHVAGMRSLADQVTAMANSVDNLAYRARMGALEEASKVCADCANDFANQQYTSQYAAGRHDQARACAVQVRELMVSS